MITRDNLLNEALKWSPAFKKEYDRLIEEDFIDSDSGDHIVFGYAFTPVLLEALKNGDKKTSENMLSFAERMAGSSDDYVQEVCDQAITEAVNGELPDDALIALFGPNMKESFEAIKTYML